MQTYCWSFLRLCFLGSTAPDVTENTKRTDVISCTILFSNLWILFALRIFLDPKSQNQSLQLVFFTGQTMHPTQRGQLKDR